MEYGSAAPPFAFVLALVSGTLLALGSYLAAAVLGGLAVVVVALWQFAEERGDDARHTLW